MKKKRDLSKYFLPNLARARKRLAAANIFRDQFEIPLNLTNYGINKFCYIKTFGCQANVRDSETLMGILEMIGYQFVNTYQEADLVILNTCAIREKAEDKVFADLGKMTLMKQINANFIIGMCGCMAQEESVVNRILKANLNLDFIIGTHNLHRILNILEQVIFEKNLVIEVWSKEGDIIENLPVKRNHNTKGFVNIMYGCDRFCTYCIVPLTRGKIRSRKKEDVLTEIQTMIAAGCKEVTLIGQNVNSYGIDFATEINYKFTDLLIDVAKTKIPRIRFSTSNPWNFSHRIVDIMQQYNNIMPHIHLPIQSGDEKVLKRMNRAMKISDYLALIAYIRKTIPNCAITTDLIVGFPNETQTEFENTLKLYHQVQFDNAFTFIFSPRAGTPAALMNDMISLDKKRERLNLLNAIVKKYAKQNNEKYINQKVEVLVDGPSKKNATIMSGYSPQWKVVNFKGNYVPGDLVQVLVTQSSLFSLNGIVAE